MFVNVNAYPGSRPTALGQLGELSRARVILSEFKYNKGTEIFGEAEPADYVYQVIDGAVRTHKLSLTAAARLARSICRATSLGWRTV